MSGDIVIYAVFAIGLLVWLKSVLGTRHGSERSRPNPFVAPRALDGAKSLPKSATPAANPGLLLEHNRAISAHSGAEQGLMEISRIDRAFSLEHFVQGAQDAFVMIVEAFAAGNRDVLRDLLSEPVYRAFLGAIEARETKMHKASVEIHAVRRAEIVDARLDRRVAYITVRFVTDETNILRDAAGTVIEGNPDRVRENIDIWTFSRDLRSRDPAWIVSETREEQEGPLPDHAGESR